MTEASHGLRVLFVCTGNVCRSAYLELRSSTLEPGIGFSSAGTAALVEGELSTEVGAELRRHGIDPAAFRSRQLTEDMVAAADLVLTAAGSHRAYILDTLPGAVAKVFTLDQFARSLTGAPGTLTGSQAIAEAARLRLAVQHTGDIADPYRRGVEAARACAATMDALLEQILPHLAGQTP